MLPDSQDTTTEEPGAEPEGPKLTTPYWPDEVAVDDTTKFEHEILTVTCETCGHDAEIQSSPLEGGEIRWKCNCAVSYYMVGDEKHPTKASGLCDCEADNVIEGLPGFPGEGDINPAATALTDDELLEAVHRRGIIHKLHLTGGIGPTGGVSSTKETPQ